jgi:hypothetical protein
MEPEMSRLKLDMSFNDAVFAMSDGNPGAITVIMDGFRLGDSIDPQGMGGWGFVLNLDQYGIYGSRVWRLYKDLCGESLSKAIAMVRSAQMGLISAETLNTAIDGTAKVDVDQTVSRLKEKLPGFRA